MPARLTTADLGRLRIPSDPAISPDGTQVVYVLSTVDPSGERMNTALWTVQPGQRPAGPLTGGTRDSAPRWSPDGAQLAFLRAVDDVPQLCVLTLGRPGEPTVLTELPYGAGVPVWSRDGRHIAFAALVRDHEPDEPDRPRPFVIRALGYKHDGLGLRAGRHRHLHVIDVNSGAVAQVTRGEWDVVSLAWGASGTELFVAGTLPAGSDTTGLCPVYRVGLDSPASPPSATALSGGYASRLITSPDGATLLAVGRTDLDLGYQSLLRLPLDGSAPTRLGRELDRNVMPGEPAYPGGEPQFTPDGQRVVYCVNDRGCSHAYSVPVDAGSAPTLVLGDEDEVVSGLSVSSASSLIVGIVSDAQSYGEVVVLDLESGARTTLTTHTRDALPDVEFFRPQSRIFTIADGTQVHGWVIADPARTGPRPMLVDVHGGPHNAWHPTPTPVNAHHQLLAARGWAILLLNQRASEGYGERFHNANVGQWGLGDEQDFRQPIEELILDGIADHSRLAISGYSYGGFMTCWLTARTDIFAAAVAGGVVADTAGLIASDAGYPDLTKELAASTWSEPERLAAQSPLTYVGGVTTPTLILHGLDDDRCPVTQSQEWFVALRAMGVATELILYPGESHGIAAPAFRQDYAERLMSWLETHVPGATA